MKILITGGTGLIGKALSEILSKKGYEVGILTRNKTTDTSIHYFQWEYEKKIIDPKALENVHGIIHLAGASVAQRWTDLKKKEIVESRTESAEFLYDELQKRKQKLQFFISASGTNFYGTKTSSVLHTEQEQAGNDFLGKVCKMWEDTAYLFEDLGARVIILRTGIVLSQKGGAFPKMMHPIRMGIGAIIGSGKQYMPWISLEDLVIMYLFFVENPQYFGCFNAVTPDIQTNSSFTKLLAKKLNKKLIPFSISPFLFRLFFGEMANILLEGSPISSKKIEEIGFVFKNPNLTAFLDSELKKTEQ